MRSLTCCRGLSMRGKLVLLHLAVLVLFPVGSTQVGARPVRPELSSMFKRRQPEPGRWLESLLGARVGGSAGGGRCTWGLTWPLSCSPPCELVQVQQPLELGHCRAQQTPSLVHHWFAVVTEALTTSHRQEMLLSTQQRVAPHRS